MINVGGGVNKNKRKKEINQSLEKERSNYCRERQNETLEEKKRKRNKKKIRKILRRGGQKKE